MSRKSSVTTKPRTESPRCSNLRSNVIQGLGTIWWDTKTRENDTYISLSKLGSSKTCIHRVLTEGRICTKPVHTRMILEETSLPSVETAMGEYL